MRRHRCRRRWLRCRTPNPAPRFRNWILPHRHRQGCTRSSRPHRKRRYRQRKGNQAPPIFGATSIIEASVVASVVARGLASIAICAAAAGVNPAVVFDTITLFFRRHVLVAAVGRTGKVEEEAAELIGATVAIYVHAFVKALVQVQHLKVVVVVKVTVVGRLIGHLKGGRVVQHAKIIV